MTDLVTRTDGRAGRITLNRPKALNALTWEMCLEIERALDAWADDDAVALVLIDGAPGRAFCAGGDIAAVFRAGTAGDHAFARRFWRDEYRMNRKIARYAKPVVALLHGFVMGGGVGVGCHCSCRVVGQSAQVAMPECGIGLIPDVGGSLLLARAPGRLGEYLGLTGTRMGPGDAIHARFADVFVPEDGWTDLAAALAESGDASLVAQAASRPPESVLAPIQDEVDDRFAGEGVEEIVGALARSDASWAEAARAKLDRNSPLSMACTLELIRRVRADDTIEAALTREFRYTSRSTERSDLLEGIRAAIIDKDRSPRWRHAGPGDVPRSEVEAMLAPLGENDLSLGDAP